MSMLKIHYTAGINTTRIRIDIIGEDGVSLRDTSCDLTFGYDVSWEMKDYRYSIKQHEDMVKYGWRENPYYNIKMFIGYVFDGYAIKCNKDWRDPANWTGYNVFAEKDLPKEEVEEIIKLIIKGYDN